MTMTGRDKLKSKIIEILTLHCLPAADRTITADEILKLVDELVWDLREEYKEINIIKLEQPKKENKES